MIASPAQEGPSHEDEDCAIEAAGSETRLSVPLAMAAIGSVSLVAWAALGVALKVLLG